MPFRTQRRRAPTLIIGIIAVVGAGTRILPLPPLLATDLFVVGWTAARASLHPPLWSSSLSRNKAIRSASTTTTVRCWFKESIVGKEDEEDSSSSSEEEYFIKEETYQPDLSREEEEEDVGDAETRSRSREEADEATVTLRHGNNSRRSHILRLQSRNLAGVVNELGEDICIPFGNHQFVAVTGETGSGKSLLVTRAVDLLQGGGNNNKKATIHHLLFTTTTTIAGNQQKKESSSSSSSTLDDNAFVEIQLQLREPYVSMARYALEELGLDPCSILSNSSDDDDGDSRPMQLVLRRSFELILPSSPSTRDTATVNKKGRWKSVCQINGATVPLKKFSQFVGPLLAVVDAATAASALSKPMSRMGMIDTAIASSLLRDVQERQKEYHSARRKRQRLEDELASRILPRGFATNSNDDNEELLSHWIDELDAFETRIGSFCASIANKVSSSSLADFDGGDDDSALDRLSQRIISTRWMDSLENNSGVFVSALYECLSDFRDSLKNLDDQVVAAHNAVDALSLLSAPNSAATAIEQARNFLFDASSSTSSSSSSIDVSSQQPLSLAAERSHELLNKVEEALTACTRFIEDSEQGLLQTLERNRAKYPIAVESLDEILMDWSSLARKHGIPASALPSCHKALQSERDGNVEARTLLPKAILAEQEALVQLEDFCGQLSRERRRVATFLSQAVTERLPSLGMSDSTFLVHLDTDTRSCTDLASTSSGPLGTDSVEFLLIHSDDASPKRGGSLHEVASSGEKARILLAIECTLPGSVGAASTTATSSSSDVNNDLWTGLPPIAVLYDEIDAHVGGRAAVSLANMLADQSESSQVIAITHSPSVAANADMHVVVQKVESKDGATFVRTTVADVSERKLELARMASGDIAVAEAEAFAEALMRDGLQKRISR